MGNKLLIDSRSEMVVLRDPEHVSHNLQSDSKTFLSFYKNLFIKDDLTSKSGERS